MNKCMDYVTNCRMMWGTKMDNCVRKLRHCVKTVRNYVEL